MKKTLIAAALALSAAAASAGVTVFGTYDYDRAEGGALKTTTEAHVGAAVDTKLGTFDASVVGARLNAGAYDDALGFELGYTNGFKLGNVGLKGRAAFGRLNQVDTVVGGFSGNTKYYSLSAEAGLPVSSTLAGYVAFRHRNGLEADTPSAQNRYSVGADLTLAKNLAVRVGVNHTRSAGEKFNGVSTAVSVKF